MRRAAKVDRNQAEIVEAFRAMGCTVHCTHTLGQGFPDLVVGLLGHNHLIEVKDWQQIPSKQKLTDDELEWHSNWRGAVNVVKTVGDAQELVKKWRKDWRVL